MSDGKNREILLRSSYFNPVDLVCFVRNLIVCFWQVVFGSFQTSLIKTQNSSINDFFFNKSKPQRPYIILFVTLILFTLPSAKPLL